MPKSAAPALPVEEVALSSYWNYRDAGSDKDYSIRLERSSDGSGWAVNVAYGRRGSTMTPGCKSGAAPVPYAKALGIYEKQVKERLGKGYIRQDGTDAGYVQATLDKVHSGIAPQLLNPIDIEEVQRLLDDPAWGAQEKHFGKRLMVRRQAEDAAVEGVNRKGFIVGYPKDIEAALASRLGEFVLDGEAIGQAIYAFDLLQDDGRDLRMLPYDERHRLLCAFVEGLGGSVVLVPLSRTSEEKRALLERLIADKAEGIVFKRLASPAVAGRPNSGGNQLKYKLYETASCLVGSLNEKRSVGLLLIRDGVEVDVGNVTIPPNQAVPEPGQVVEIRYLHAYQGGSLYETFYMGERDDVDRNECLLSQLKYKS